jgi:hypothetical protein
MFVTTHDLVIAASDMNTDSDFKLDLVPFVANTHEGRPVVVSSNSPGLILYQVIPY